MTTTKRPWRNPNVRMAAEEYKALTNRRYGDLKVIAGKYDVTPRAVCAYISRGGHKA